MLYKMYIDGQWREGSSRRDVISPATGEAIGQLSIGEPADIDDAVEAALRAQQALEDMTVFERADMLCRIADEISLRGESLARLLSAEQGKTLTEARGEVSGCELAFRECASQIKWMNSTIIPSRDGDRLCMAFRKPVGVFGIITPWNFPLGTPVMYYLAPGLAAGCPLIWNPATSTAAVASALMECVDASGVPAGFLSLVIGPGVVLGDALVTHPRVAGIGFTGSTETGNIICSRAKAKHTLIELGGNGPCIVLKDADLDLAADKLTAGSFSNAGQICTSTERVLADDSIADELIEKIMSRMGRFVLGDPSDPTTTVGPMHAADTIAVVHAHINDAVSRGARVLMGGKRKPGTPTPNYIEPTVLDDVDPDALINIEETFGPVLPILRFKDESEIPRLVRKSPYRLFAAIFTRDIDKAIVMARGYNFGCVNVNEASNFWDTMLPAGGGGGGASGHGRSGGMYSILEFSEERVVNISLQTNVKGGRQYGTN